VYLEKHALVKYLPKHRYKKNLEPDGAYVDETRKMIFILELKNQTGEGSVAEKIQTGPFKIKKYTKRYPDYTFRFAYILSSWWFHKGFEDDLEILEEEGIPVFWADQLGDEVTVKFTKKNVSMFPKRYTTDFNVIDTWLTQ
jgi:hypothetical protein